MNKPMNTGSAAQAPSCAKQYPTFVNTHAINIIEHYYHAREKHPYFCDMVTRDLWTVKDIQNNLKRIRQYIEQDIARHEVEAISLLICETREFEEAMTLKNTTSAVDELYDVIAVCLRIIDVLEGRQPLGKPKEGAK